MRKGEEGGRVIMRQTGSGALRKGWGLLRTSHVLSSQLNQSGGCTEPGTDAEHSRFGCSSPQKKQRLQKSLPSITRKSCPSHQLSQGNTTGRNRMLSRGHHHRHGHLPSHHAGLETALPLQPSPLAAAALACPGQNRWHSECPSCIIYSHKRLDTSRSVSEELVFNPPKEKPKLHHCLRVKP